MINVEPIPAAAVCLSCSGPSPTSCASPPGASSRRLARALPHLQQPAALDALDWLLQQHRHHTRVLELLFNDEDAYCHPERLGSLLRAVCGWQQLPPDAYVPLYGLEATLRLRVLDLRTCSVVQRARNGPAPLSRRQRRLRARESAAEAAAASPGPSELLNDSPPPPPEQLSCGQRRRRARRAAAAARSSDDTSAEPSTAPGAAAALPPVEPPPRSSHRPSGSHQRWRRRRAVLTSSESAPSEASAGGSPDAPSCDPLQLRCVLHGAAGLRTTAAPVLRFTCSRTPASCRLRLLRACCRPPVPSRGLRRGFLLAPALRCAAVLPFVRMRRFVSARAQRVVCVTIRPTVPCLTRVSLLLQDDGWRCTRALALATT